MAAPPAKRQRKLVVLSSSDNEELPSIEIESPEKKHNTTLVCSLAFLRYCPR